MAADNTFLSLSLSLLKIYTGFTGPDGGPCVECINGTYKTAAGSDSCTACPMGTYSAAIRAIAMATCMACPSSATSLAASTTKSDCICATGYTGAHCQGSPTVCANCTACEAGKYKDTTGRHPCLVFVFRGHLFCVPMCFCALATCVCDVSVLISVLTGILG